MSSDHDSKAHTPSQRMFFVCTHSFAMRTLYKGLFPYFEDLGFQVDALTGDDEFLGDLPKEHFGTVKPMVIPMERKPAPLRDIQSLIRLTKHFSKNKYDLIHVSTPKASLLCSIAAKLTKNGPIVFVYRRCVYETKVGLKRRIFKAIDKFTASMSTRVFPISKQLQNFLIEEKICAEAKTNLVGEGSSNGIDIKHFKSTPATKAAGKEFRDNKGISPNQPVVLYLGRLIHEKGVDLLPEIFLKAKSQLPELKMIVAGPEEGNRDPISPETKEFFETNPDIVRVDFVVDPRPLFEAADLFCFPSHFEGFGNVLLEASAMGVPSVAFDVPGVQEAVAHEKSGRLVRFGDTDAITNEMVEILRSQELRARLSNDGLERIDRVFGQDAFFKKLEQAFLEVIAISKTK